jgi:hypothetical protein
MERKGTGTSRSEEETAVVFIFCLQNISVHTIATQVTGTHIEEAARVRKRAHRQGGSPLPNQSENCLERSFVCKKFLLSTIAKRTAGNALARARRCEQVGLCNRHGRCPQRPERRGTRGSNATAPDDVGESLGEGRAPIVRLSRGIRMTTLEGARRYCDKVVVEVELGLDGNWRPSARA